MEEKKKGKGSVVVIIILLLIIIGLCGFIYYDKFLSNNSKVDAEVDNKETKKEVEKETDTDKEEVEIEEEATAEDTNGYVEKVYSWSENGNTRTIVLFKSGSCVSTSNYEYTAKCRYKIENNKIIITSTRAGISRGEEYVINYLITYDESNQEIIKQEDHPEIVLKYLK